MNEEILRVAQDDIALPASMPPRYVQRLASSDGAMRPCAARATAVIFSEVKNLSGTAPLTGQKRGPSGAGLSTIDYSQRPSCDVCDICRSRPR